MDEVDLAEIGQIRLLGCPRAVFDRGAAMDVALNTKAFDETNPLRGSLRDLVSWTLVDRNHVRVHSTNLHRRPGRFTLSSSATRELAPRLLVGLMSGMSMDGLDLALVRIEGPDERPQVTLRDHDTQTYDAALRTRLLEARSGTVEDVAVLDFDLAECWSRWVLSFLEHAGYGPRDVCAVGSHGQTLFHRPQRTGALPARTLQVGRGDLLALRTGIRTVWRLSELVTLRWAAKGRRSFPMVDWLLYRDEQALHGVRQSRQHRQRHDSHPRRERRHGL